MKFILLIIILSGDIDNIAQVKFETLDLCEQAATLIVSQRQWKRLHWSAQPVVECVKVTK